MHRPWGGATFEKATESPATGAEGEMGRAWVWGRCLGGGQVTSCLLAQDQQEPVCSSQEASPGCHGKEQWRRRQEQLQGWGANPGSGEHRGRWVRGAAGWGSRPAMAEKGVIKYVLLMPLLPSVNRAVLKSYTPWRYRSELKLRVWTLWYPVHFNTR